ncbi:hypothetical protein UA08_01253 [Talaromyces atroroseus]|uniref:Major facilitator superfamily (MFS) profile domain-containing protein n=1 Tax=Talaromyces atroroseus TaxID=1441469 RepID=A0A1Q5QB62_TALAT|nr:hypothetical protein UA08_01253 [Talaromyces atroroseus]OKL63121.1 hypothetical protein UA08_01253 [Talaromyces atroroseus]
MPSSSNSRYIPLSSVDPQEAPSNAASTDNPFSNPGVADLYRQVYEDAQYECRDYFDPELSWTAEEEARLVGRIDRRVCLWACIMFFALQMDRGNLVQALSDNMLDDLNLNTNGMNIIHSYSGLDLNEADYNVGNTLFLIAFTFAELPSQLISKRIGPDVWIPTLITLWSMVAMSQAGLRGIAGFYTTRILLGLFEGGFVPDIILWLSYFYTSRELPIRLRWIFLLEGMITLLIGLMSYFMMPASIVETKSWYRPNGWFTEQELGIAVNRILRDDPSKAITFSRLWNAAKDYDLWPLYLVGFLADIPVNPLGTYIPLILRNLGFSTPVGNTLERDPYLHPYRNNMAHLWTLPCLIALRFWSGAMTDAWGTYALVVVTLSYPATRAIVLGWISKNSNTVSTRSVSVTLYNIFVEAGYVYSNNVYREDDKPLYHRGNRNLIAINVLTIIVFLLIKVYYVHRNRHRDRVWAKMDAKDRSKLRD